MFCVRCKDLYIINKIGECKSCESKTNYNISIICDDCSEHSKECASCLKKLYYNFDTNPVFNSFKKKCNTC